MSVVLQESHRLKPRCQQDCISFWNLWGRISFLALSNFWRLSLAWLVGLFLHLQHSNRDGVLTTLHPSDLLSCPSGPLWLPWVCLDNLVYSPYFKISWLATITLSATLTPLRHVMYLQVFRVSMWTSQGWLTFLYLPPGNCRLDMSWTEKQEGEGSSEKCKWNGLVGAKSLWSIMWQR